MDLHWDQFLPIFLCVILKDCLHSWFRYVDDTFTLFENKEAAEKFLRYINNRHTNIKFTMELEVNNQIPFLDILVKRNQDHTFYTSIFRKRTFTGLYTKWDSFTPRKYKINLIRTLTFHCLRICSSSSLLQSGLSEIRKLLLQNGYPVGIISYNMNDVLNRHQAKFSNPFDTVPKKDTILVLPNLRFQSEFATHRLKSCIK